MIVNNGDFLVLESNGGQLLQVTPDGKITRLADLSAADARPSGIAVTTNGGILVGQGNAVVAIAADGSTSNSWTGLKDVVDVAVGPDGTLYALEADGRVVRQSGSDAAKDVATGFQDPSSLAFGPDGGLYVSSPASGGDPTAGSVVRLSTDFGQVLTMSPAILTGSPCLPTPTPTAPPVTPATGTPGSGTPAGSATSTQAAGSTVEIKNFAFNPTSLTVSAGTTVTWTNNDAVAHTVTASDGSFDSGNLAPGDSWSHTFTAAGSFDYRCNYHPDMLAKVIVN
jgi:plastocyanin